MCPYCDLENSFSFGQLKDGLILNCNDCKKRIEFKSSFELVPRDGIPKQTQLDISKTDDSSQLEIEVVRSDIKSN